VIKAIPGVELVELSAPAQAAETQPADEPEPAQEEVEEEPVQEEVEEEPAIPDEPTTPKRAVLTPPPSRPKKTLEERLSERLDAQDQSRPVQEQRDVPREQPAPAQTSTARVTASRFPYGWYLSVIQGKVSSNWDQPSARLLAEDSLTASVSFTIRRDGSVHGIQVSRSSGRSTVDQSAARAVRDSAPFPPLPDDYMRDTLEVTIDFTIVRE